MTRMILFGVLFFGLLSGMLWALGEFLVYVGEEPEAMEWKRILPVAGTITLFVVAAAALVVLFTKEKHR